MKNINILLILTLVLVQSGLGQSRYQNTLDVPPSKVQLPRLVDINKFKRDIEYTIPLKEVYDQQKRDTLIGVYMYGFNVGFDGKVSAASNHNPKDFHKIQQYVDSLFNNYKWLPASRKGCPKCKLVSYLDLAIYFQTEDKEPNVYIEIRMLRNPKQAKRVLFSYRIPYNKLK